MRRLENKVAIVTGAARGIGRGIAERFAREGARVGVLDLDEMACHNVADLITAHGGEAIALIADVSDESSVAAAIEQIAYRFGAVTVLVNNAAVMPGGKIHEVAPPDFAAASPSTCAGRI